MTFLFLRFYFCVLAILAVAWMIQAYNASQIKDKNFQVVQEAYGGQVRLVSDLVSKAEDRVEEIEALKPMFDFGLTYVAPEVVKDDLNSEWVFFENENGVHIISELPTQDGYVVFGPLPELIAPSLSAQLFGLAIVLLLAAMAIALILHPVVKQLRVVEKTAIAIAGGQYQARVDEIMVGSAKQLAQAFNLMAEKTEKLLGSQRQLLQCVSHELRTPISKLRFAIDLGRSAGTEEEFASRLVTMETATDELETLVNELLGYVKLDSKQTDLNVELCNLKEMIARQFDLHQDLFPHIHFEMSEAIDSDEFTIEADRVMLERVFANLIGNGAKFAESHVRVSAEPSISGLSIRFEDDGCGIPAESREAVFAPFRVDHHEQSGTGLGLTIVQMIVETHGSKIEITDSELGGCCVVLDWVDQPSLLKS